jgi:hypothetical protein
LDQPEALAVTVVGTTLVIGELTPMLSVLTEALTQETARQFTVIPPAESSSVAPTADRVASRGRLLPLESNDHDSWTRALIDVPSIDWLIIGPSQSPRRESLPSDNVWADVANQAAYFAQALGEAGNRIAPQGACLLVGPMEHPQTSHSNGMGLLVEGFAQTFAQLAAPVRVNAIRPLLDADSNNGELIAKGAEGYGNLITAADYLLSSRLVSGQTLSVRLF